MNLLSVFLIDERISVPFLLIFGAVLAVLLLWLKRRSLSAAFGATCLFPLVYCTAGLLLSYQSYFHIGPYPMVGIMGVCLSVLMFLWGLFSISRVPADWKGERLAWPIIWARWLLIIILALNFLFLLLWGFQVVGILLFCLFTGAVWQAVQAARFARSFEIISTLTLCVRQNLPLAMAIKTAAQHSKKSVKSILERITHWLVQGYPLSEALRKGWPQAPAHLTAALYAGEQIGQLPQTLETLLADQSEKAWTKQYQSNWLIYPAAVLVLIILITSGLLTFVFPVFLEVITDVADRAQLPLATQVILAIFQILLHSLKFFLILVTAAVVYAAVAAFYSHRGRPLRLKERIVWHLPLLGQFHQQRSLRQLLQYLRPALEVGLDLPEALEKVLSLKLNPCFQKQIQRWLHYLRRGYSPDAAALLAKMDSKIVWAFSRPNQSCLPGVLSMLEESIGHTLHYRRRLLSSIAFPLTILVMAVVVGTVVLAFFLPVVHIIYITGGLVLP
ncbi:MAG TPA: type II secretion system F family protein [Anaerohalosphaeraceae bacterium]|nr:type II secretion system F family protein [Anaerohalosphaeraceae bacterium]HRT24692.1 type II secretion system F family protein [Anaerohalosphaeraceae bacterium]HRV21278.1 type II secretion system F family protein [Anaerohalosphaeraceae bacterium]